MVVGTQPKVAQAGLVAGQVKMETPLVDLGMKVGSHQQRVLMAVLSLVLQTLGPLAAAGPLK